MCGIYTLIVKYLKYTYDYLKSENDIISFCHESSCHHKSGILMT